MEAAHDRRRTLTRPRHMVGGFAGGAVSFSERVLLPPRRSTAQRQRSGAGGVACRIANFDRSFLSGQKGDIVVAVEGRKNAFPRRVDQVSLAFSAGTALELVILTVTTCSPPSAFVVADVPRVTDFRSFSARYAASFLPRQ